LRRALGIFIFRFIFPAPLNPQAASRDRLHLRRGGAELPGAPHRTGVVKMTAS
jgi:hypothetical protein